MRLCVIGNSHVGMLRAAGRAPEAEGLSLTFFAKAGQGLERARIRGSVIAAIDPELSAAQARFGMPGEVDVADFDAVIFVAGTASVFSAMKILQTCRVSDWPSSKLASAPGEANEPSDRQLVSNSVYSAALADWTRAGVSYQLAQALRAATDVAMFIVPQPYPGAQVLDSHGPRYAAFRRIQADRDGAALAAGLSRALDLAFADIPDIRVLHQPKDTVAHGFLTDAAYTRDAVRVDGDTTQLQSDVLHVGAAFGSRVLARVASALETDVPVAPILRVPARRAMPPPGPAPH